MKARIRGAAGTTFKSFQIRNFRLFFTGQTISQIGTWLTTIALTLLVLHRTNSGLAIGFLAACQFGPMLVLGAWAGVVVDRSDKRRLLIITQILEMGQSFGLAFLAFVHHAPLVSFYLMALAGGFMLAFDNPARRAFVAEMVPIEDVQNAVTLNTALMTSSRVVGPAIAGLLVVTVGYGWCFTVDAISYVAVVVGLWMMRPAELRQPPVTAKAKGQVRAGLRYVRDVPDLFVPLVMTAIVGTLAFNFPTVVPLFVEHTLHGTDTSYTLIYSVLSVGSVMAALVAANRKLITVTTLVTASLVFGVSLLIMACAPNLGVAYPLALLMGFASVGFMTGSTALVQVRADPAMRGRVIALQAMVFIGSTPIGGPILGAVCDRYGARAGLVLGGLAALVAAAWGWRAVRHPAARFRTAAAAADEPQLLELDAERLQAS